MIQRKNKSRKQYCCKIKSCQKKLLEFYVGNAGGYSQFSCCVQKRNQNSYEYKQRKGNKNKKKVYSVSGLDSHFENHNFNINFSKDLP